MEGLSAEKSGAPAAYDAERDSIRRIPNLKEKGNWQTELEAVG